MIVIIKIKHKQRIKALVGNEKCTHAADIKRGFLTFR